jgi:hypothetical protein
MTDTKFLRDIHDLSKASAPSNKPVNSLIEPSEVPFISAYVAQHYTAVAQSRGNIGYLAFVPGYSAEIRPSGSPTATGWSQWFFIVENHLMAYPGEIVSANLGNSAWIATGYAQPTGMNNQR